MDESSSKVVLAVDCMGGDAGPAVTLPACGAFLSSHPQAQLLLVGRPEAFAAWPQVLNNVRCRVVPATEVVEMDDAVEVALLRLGLADLAKLAAGNGEPVQASGKQERYENLLNQYLLR